MKLYRLALSSCVGAIAVSLATPAFAGDLNGYVYDSTDTVALDASQIRIVELDRTVSAQSDGSFHFADVPAGTYTVVANYVGAEPVTETVTVPETGAATLNFLVGSETGGILVIGQYANLSSALSRKRDADGVTEVLTRDAIGQFPDQNAAESLRRLPGINILDDQGEGRYVSIRGLDPELNSTSINGVRLPSPESDVRSVALDVISNDVIESIEVKKSLTPDMDADSIGASVEIRTTSAFDRKKDYYSVRLEGSYNDYSGDITPKGSFDFSKRLGDNFGISGGVSYYERKFETDNVESDPWETVNGIAYSPVVEYRDYDVTRKRLNATLNLDWRVSDSTKAYIRGNWSQFDDHEYRRRTTFDMGKIDPASGTGTSASFDDADGTIKIERDLKDRFERQRISTVAIGSETDTGIWKFDWQASYAKSSEKENGSIDPIRFSNKFKNDGVIINWDYSDPRVPQYTLVNGADEVNDPDNYELDKIEITTLSDSEDREWALSGNLARSFAIDGGDFTIQVGAKQRWRKKFYNLTQTDYEGNDITMADYLGSQTYRLDGISLGPVLGKSAGIDFMAANGAALELNAEDTLIDSIADDYSAREDITAAYALGRWDSDTLRVIGGVRMERTHNKLGGNLYNEDTLDIQPVTFERSYTDWLPSLTVRYAPDNHFVFRLAGYKSLVRPKLSAMAPRNVVNEDEEAEFGNPDLKPYRAWNADAGVSYYFGENAGLSVGAFYKDIKDYAVTQTFDDYTYQGVTYRTFQTTINGDSATVYGIEASYSQAYTMLPSPFDGLLTQLNYTYTNAKGTLADGREIALPSASRNTFNAVLGYEKGPITLRLAGTFRDKYLDEIGDDASEDRIVDKHFQLDFSGKLKINSHLRFTLDIININNARYFAYQNYAAAQRLLQFEKYGPTVKFGARLTF